MSKNYVEFKNTLFSCGQWLIDF